jgi:hypothetical protein
MKKLSVLCVALCVSLSTAAAFARGSGMGSHHMSVTGGASGASAAAPGTNSSGTALSSSGTGNGPMKGPALGTNPATDPEEVKVDKMIGSICRGCWLRAAAPCSICCGDAQRGFRVGVLKHFETGARLLEAPRLWSNVDMERIIALAVVVAVVVFAAVYTLSALRGQRRWRLGAFKTG